MKNAYAQLLKTFQQRLLAPSPEAEPRLGIYRHAYSTRLFDVIAADYPLLEKALGEKPFRALVQEYIADNPSTYWDLQHYSDAFADFVQQKHNSLPGWAGTLSQIERARFRVTDKPALPAFILSDTPDLPTLLTLQLIAQPASETIASRYDLDALIEGNSFAVIDQPGTYFIHAHEGATEVTALDEDEAAALAMLTGKPLGEWLAEVYAELGANPGFSPEKIQQWLFRWTSRRMLAERR